MAIIFKKEISGIYPAYNDSFLEFYSDSNNTSLKAEITLLPTSIFPRKFVIYPDLEGNFLFNLKEAVKIIFNKTGFEDVNFFDNGFYKNIDGLYLSQDLTVKIISEVSEEEVIKNYEFSKSVKQIGEFLFTNNFQLLTYTTNGINHNLTYFEGFPFSFDIKRVTYGVGVEISIKNRNTETDTGKISPTTTGAFRFNIDNSEGNNWTTKNFLPLISGNNKLEIYENENFKTNLNLKKVNKCKGIYLKWLNSEGGYSYFLFDEFFNENTDGKDIDLIENNQFENVGESGGNLKSIGRDSKDVLSINAKYDHQEYKVLKDLFRSPFIQLYTSNLADIKGEFIDVTIKGSLNFNNKKAINEISISINKPKIITFKL